MTRVLILDSDATLTSAVSRALTGVGLEVVQYNRPADARRDGQGFDLMIVDSRYVEIADDVPAAHTVVMFSYAPATEQQHLARRFTILRKPFTSLELLSLVIEEVGPLEPRHSSFVDALRSAHAHRRTLRFAGRDGAFVTLVEGEIHDAARGDLRGEEALKALLRAPSAMREEPIGGTERTVHRRFKRLLLGLLSELDDDERDDA